MAEADASEFQHWLTPPEALEALTNVGDYSTRCETLIERLSVDLAVGAAEVYRRERYGDEIARVALWAIPAKVWAKESPSSRSKFWETGQFSYVEHGYPSGDVTHRFFGVRFDPAGIASILRAAGLTRPKQPPIKPTLTADAAPPPPQPEKNKGGRPRNEYWEPLLIEMARQLYAGDLQPQRQADIENAMHDWLSTNGHKGGETQVRQRARSLWEAIEK